MFTSRFRSFLQIFFLYSGSNGIVSFGKKEFHGNRFMVTKGQNDLALALAYITRKFTGNTKTSLQHPTAAPTLGYKLATSGFILRNISNTGASQNQNNLKLNKTSRYAYSSSNAAMTSLKNDDGYGGSGLNWTPPNSTCSLIFMHGLGDTAQGWAGIVDMFSNDILNKVRIILPTAPVRPVTLMMGAPVPAWSDIYGLDDNAMEDEKGLSESAKRIRGIITGEIARGIPPERIIVGGFSQGGAVAYLSALGGSLCGDSSTNIPIVGGLLALSCWWPLRNHKNINPNANKNIPCILHCHGTSDDVVHFSFGSQSVEYVKALLNDLGTPMDIISERLVLKPYPQMGHSTCPQQMKDIREFVQRLLG